MWSCLSLECFSDKEAWCCAHRLQRMARAKKDSMRGDRETGRCLKPDFNHWVRLVRLAHCRNMVRECLEASPSIWLSSDISDGRHIRFPYCHAQKLKQGADSSFNNTTGQIYGEGIGYDRSQKREYGCITIRSASRLVFSSPYLHNKAFCIVS